MSAPEPKKKKKDGKTKIIVKGLEALTHVGEGDIRKWFEAFGDIEDLDFPKDPQSGRNKGYAIVDYVSKDCAKHAAKKMDGVELVGQRIKVSRLSESEAKEYQQEENLDDDTGSRYIHSA